MRSILALGGDLEITFPGDAGSTEELLKSLSARVTAALSADLRNLEGRLPLIVRVNVGYLLDNSSLLIEQVENTRYMNLYSPYKRSWERRHLITRIERFAMEINRVDRIFWALGVETPFEAGRKWRLSPIVEWQWDFPVNRQGFTCPDYTALDRAAGSRNEILQDDGCLKNYRSSASPMWFISGVRIGFPVHGLSALLGAEIGIFGVTKFARELTPTAPYRALAAIGYDIDPGPTRTQ